MCPKVHILERGYIISISILHLWKLRHGAVRCFTESHNSQGAEAGSEPKGAWILCLFYSLGLSFPFCPMGGPQPVRVSQL